MDWLLAPDTPHTCNAKPVPLGTVTLANRKRPGRQAEGTSGREAPRSPVKEWGGLLAVRASCDGAQQTAEENFRGACHTSLLQGAFLLV